jgi:hypothetical protein
MKTKYTKEWPTEEGYFWAKAMDKFGVYQKQPAFILILGTGKQKVITCRTLLSGHFDNREQNAKENCEYRLMFGPRCVEEVA